MNKTQDTKSVPANVIDATARLQPAPRRKVLKAPALSPEEAKLIDSYIAARRRQHAAAAQADSLKGKVIDLLITRKQVARRGALVSIDHTYTYHYSAAVQALAKTLSDARGLERDTGVAKAIVGTTVAFEDVRRKEQERINATGKRAG